VKRGNHRELAQEGMDVIKLARVVLAALLIAACGSVCMAVDKRPPNVVVILADDFGVGDIQALWPSNKIRTPELDRLMREGMGFTDAHSASAVCTPTRYGLLTGRYCWRTRLQEWVLGTYEPPLIDAERLTLPGLLKKHGYRTACMGKWHLGWQWPGEQPSRMTRIPNALWKAKWDFSKPIAGGPTTRGFDYYFGVDVPNFPPFTFIENDRVVAMPTARYQPDNSQGVYLPKNFSGTPMAPGWDLREILPEITRRAVRFIRQQAKQDAPFFLYFPMTSPHFPIVPTEKFAGKSGIAPIGDFLMQTDFSAGQIIRAIDEAGIAQNTIVIFTADNGHSEFYGCKKLVEAGHLPSGPYRGYKTRIWEGGHRVPFVVRWPGRIAPGSSSDQLLCLNDIFATCAELLGERLPDNAAEDSFSFLPALLGKPAVAPGTAAGRPNLVSHSLAGEFAYREGPWKLVFKMPGGNPWKLVFEKPGRRRHPARGKPCVVQLYNLDSDIGEKHDLAKKHPEIVRRLTVGLKRVVDQGRSRPGPKQPNDTDVRFDTIQEDRWAPAAE